MKIAIVTPGFSTVEDSPELPFLLDFCSWLNKRHTVEIYSLQYPKISSSYTIADLNVFAPGNASLPIKINKVFSWEKTLRTMMKSHDNERFDIIHSFWANEPGFFGAFVSKALNIPFMVSICGGEFVFMPEIFYGKPLPKWKSYISELMFRQSDVITVGSQYMIEKTPALNSKHLDKTIVAPFGINTELFFSKKHVQEENDFHILNVGWLAPVKNQKLLLESVALLKNSIPTIKLTLTSNGELEHALRQQVIELGISDCTHFVGYQSRNALAELYHSADVLVSASYHEAQGMAILEALACGVPVVATPVGIAPEIKDNLTILSSYNKNELAALLERLYSQRPVFRQKAIINAEIIKNRFSIASCMTAFEETYAKT